MQVNIHEAKTQLSKLIEAAQRGEDVIIARAGKPVVKMVALPQARRKFKFGVPGLIGMPVPDFLEPMTEEELRELE
ncbi:MAG: type II toxin-antitoxin system Phd/YefM family antitoxin [Paracoccaceae bacterium]